MNDDMNAADFENAATLTDALAYAIRELQATLDLVNSDARQVRSGRLLEGVGDVAYQVSTVASEVLESVGDDVVWNEFPKLA